MEDPVAESEALLCFKERRAKFGSSAGRDAALKFVPRPTDVFISTTPKAGTTWMSQICHQLRTGGHMDFGEITEVVPFLEMAADVGQSCDAQQIAEPRIYKTHLWEPACPSGARYIVVLRHPYDVAISQFNFLEGWMFDVGDITANEFIQQVWLVQSMPQTATSGYCQRNSAFHHFMSWWHRRNDDNVLLVFYEDMKENLEREVKRVARFIGVKDRCSVTTALARSSFEYMYEHRSQFDEHLLKELRNQYMGLDKMAGCDRGKVASAGGKRHLLNTKTISLIDEAWRDVCQPVTGASCYEDWRDLWHREQSTRSPA